MNAMRLPARVLCGFLACVAGSVATAQEMPMPRSYYALTVTMGGGAGIVVAMVPQEVGGKIAFCGALWPLNEKGEVLSRKQAVLREVKVEVRGKDVPARFSVFPEYASAEKATKARCAVTNKPWQGPYKPADINMKLRNSALRE